MQTRSLHFDDDGDSFGLIRKRLLAIGVLDFLDFHTDALSMLPGANSDIILHCILLLLLLYACNYDHTLPCAMVKLQNFHQNPIAHTPSLMKHQALLPATNPAYADAYTSCIQ